MTTPRTLRRRPAETPASLAAAQLAYERQYTDAQKLDFAFRYVLKLCEEQEEQERADVYIAKALDSIQRDVRSVHADLRPRGPGSPPDQPPGLFELMLAQLARGAELLARSEVLCTRLEQLAVAVEDRLLTSDDYTAQAKGNLRLLGDEVRENTAELRELRQALAPTPQERSVGEPAAIVLVSRSVAAD